jgi:hypothetical protein
LPLGGIYAMQVSVLQKRQLKAPDVSAEGRHRVCGTILVRKGCAEPLRHANRLGSEPYALMSPERLSRLIEWSREKAGDSVRFLLTTGFFSRNGGLNAAVTARMQERIDDFQRTLHAAPTPLGIRNDALDHKHSSGIQKR